MRKNRDRRNGKASRMTRREVLRRSAGLGRRTFARSVKLAAAAPEKIVVRTPGGAYEDALKKGAFEPFTAATGIEVVPFATNVAKLTAMIESGQLQVDVADLGEFPTVTFANRGALEKIDKSKFTRTNLADLSSVHEYYVGENTYGTVMGYNKEIFAKRSPQNWADFWNVKDFPGPRMLEDMGAEYPNLEFALLADGVPMDKLYPIDIARAFKKMREIRPNITKWWDTGAASAQMLATNQVVLGSVWNGRILPLIDDNAPVAINWNQSARQVQALCILKGTKNLEAAHKYIDFAMQPKPQADVARLSGYGPTNKRAFEHVDAKTAERLPTSPEHSKISYQTDAAWWVAHRAEVADKWQAFLLGE